MDKEAETMSLIKFYKNISNHDDHGSENQDIDLDQSCKYLVLEYIF